MAQKVLPGQCIYLYLKTKDWVSFISESRATGYQALHGYDDRNRLSSGWPYAKDMLTEFSSGLLNIYF